MTDSREDREHLRTLTTGHLNKLHKNVSRSIRELTEYQEALGDVLAEREREGTT